MTLRGSIVIALRFLKVLVSGCISLALAGCSDSDSSARSGQASTETTSTSTLDAARATGRIRVGYANEAPYAYMDSASGQLMGEAVEIAKVVLDKLGVTQIEGVLTEFGSLIPGLQAGRFDMIAAGMYVTPQRCRQVAFSNPTYQVGQAFIVAQGNPLGLNGYQDVADNEKARLGVVVGAIESEYAAKLGIPESRIVVFPDAASALAGVAAGRADAYAATALTVNDLLQRAGEYSGLERAQPFTDPVINGQGVLGYGAFAFRQEDQDFVAAFNVELAAFVGTDAHAERVGKWGFSKTELPGDVTAAQLCAR